MHVTSLPLLEERLRQSGNKGEYSFRKFSIPVPGEDLALEGQLCTPNGRSGYYYAVTHPKERIVIHFTAGNIVSDLSALTRHNYHVSVPFVIARDGTIYQLYSSKFWSGNIGKGLGNEGTGNAQDKCTIGIELSNYGFLTERNGKLETYYSRQKNSSGNTGPVDVYCSLDDHKAYQKLNTPFRGESYYATHTEEQYNSLIILLRYLTAQYNIPRQFLPESKRFIATNEVLNFKGIVSHVNYRATGKWDIGPAFDWNKVINGVQASNYIPTKQRSVQWNEEVEGAGVIRSEEELIPLLPEPRDSALEDEAYEEESKPGKPKLFALLVGISDYAEEIVLGDKKKLRFPKLSGCVKDAEKLKDFLEQDNYYDTQIVLLTDQEASKEKIVSAFKEHLGKAQENDTALFYYSGHGTQEKADPAVFKSETDGKLESVVCYYDEHTMNDFLLADKELRWLIGQVAVNKPHIVTIFDCCHSADITRNGELATKSFEKTVEKRIPFVFPKRGKDQFIFSKEITEDEITQSGEYKALTEGQHIQFSACESNESAVEVAGEGVFTKALLKVLKTTGGNISYYSLRSRIRQYLQTIYEQKPRIYATDNDQSLLYATFLNKGFHQDNKSFGEVTYNENTGWQINLGAIHGISKDAKGLKIIDPDNRENRYDANIGTVKIDTSQLLLDAPLDREKTYYANIEGAMAEKINLHIAESNALLTDQEMLLNELTKQLSETIILQEKEEEAQYVLRFLNGRYYLTYPNDPYRPLIEPIEPVSEKSLLPLVKYLNHISIWHFIKNLTNQDESNQIPGDAVDIQVAVGNENYTTDHDDKISINFTKTGNKWQSSIKVRITNNSDNDLYCAALYLASDFRSSTGFLNPPVYLLERNNSVELTVKGNSTIPIYLDDVMKWYNWHHQTDCIKFIISTGIFDSEALNLEKLPSPHLPGAQMRALKAGIGDEEMIDKKSISGWYTKDLTIELQNPEFNTIAQEDLNTMLKDERTTDFALGLYYDGALDENLQTSYILKPEITLRDEKNQLAEKGFIQDRLIDVANWWARRKRNRLYEQITKRFPERIRIVSEGDSWFQHPLVLDIIDHVSRTYAVYCTAAAGDTLRNYFSKEKNNGEYYLDAIDEQRPDFFLISGGGNDILGAQFRNYLSDFPDDDQPEGESPKRFLKQSLFDEIDALMEIYKTLFNHLKVHKPALHVIVHGYDYPVKLNDADKGWLGRYMIEKGIYRPGDRKAIICLIMNHFNEKLEAVSNGFDNVSYLDVRNITRFDETTGIDQWYDEIHPNSDGFQQIAMKFIREIDEIVKARSEKAKSTAELS